MLNSLDGMDGVLPVSGDVEDDLLPTFEDLTPFEVEHFVQDLREFKLEEVGGPQWLTQHERIERLNWTAHNQAKEGLDEYVVDQLNTFEKIPLLIYDLILVELWKCKIWPLVKAKIAKFSSLRTYIPIYHEASVVNLLEVCLFHRTSCEEAGDALIDLVDYCVRKLKHLLSIPNSELVRQVASAKEINDWDSVRCLDEQFAECEFQVCMCTISLLRFLTDHRVAVPLAVTIRLLETHDVLLLLVPLMEKAPWVRKNRRNSAIEKFEEHRWERVEQNDEGRLPKLHSQVWLTVYNLVMDAECRARYELISFRRENLLRLRRHINEVVVDQLPPLTNLHRTLEELAISGQFTAYANAPAATPFVVELVAEAHETLVRTYEGRWEEVAEKQLREVLVKETPEELTRLGNMISVPKEYWDEGPSTSNIEESKDDSQPDGGDHFSQVREAWDSVLALHLVQSTASFFAAARADDALPTDVIILSAPQQEPPLQGGCLRLELRRSSQKQVALSSRGAQRVRAEAALYTRAYLDDETFSLTIEANGFALDAVRSLQYVSTKGAKRTSKQLKELLGQPQRKELFEMYSKDIAEFSVPIGADGNTVKDRRLDYSLIKYLVDGSNVQNYSTL